MIHNGDRHLSEINHGPHRDLGGVVSNAFGEHYLFSINRNVFQGTDASTVFRSHFDDSLFEEDTLYVIAGTDSGLLCQYIKACGAPKGSRYLFVELPEVLEQLIDMDAPQAGVAVTTLDHWQSRGIQALQMPDYAIQDRLVLVRSLGVVHGHYSGYLPFWRKLKEAFDVFLKSYQIGLNNRPFILRQIENLTENQTPALYLKDRFRGKTAVVLAGGPSLDELAPWVREHRQNLLVIAVSRISRSLIEAGIQPDICVSVDPYAINLNVSREMLEFQDDTLLVNEYHLASNVLSSWGGSKAYMGRRYPWSTPLEPENLPPSQGSTVTNTALDLAVETGVSQVILGGADFCFSQTGYTHASGSAEHALGPRPMHGDKRVETNSGMMADSHHAFLKSAKTLDRQAGNAAERHCRVINPAAGAMRLPHVEYMPLENIDVNALERPAQEIIADCLPAETHDNRVAFYRESLTEVDRVLSELRSIKSLSRKALDYNRKLFERDKRDGGRHNNAKLENVEKQFAGKYAATFKFVKSFGLRRLLPILRQHDERDEDLKESSRLYFQAVIDTSDELADVMGQARKRILSRLEEEQPEPKIEGLVEQWRRDHQPGRVLRWTRLHADKVAQLSDKQQQALHSCEESFAESVEKLNRGYSKGIEDGVKLDGAAARAREYFQCHDEEALQGLLAGLEEHRDQVQAMLIIPLLQGYLAELHNDPNAALHAYGEICHGPAHIDALMRLFDLHTKNNDMDSALGTLKTLTGISSTYIPMYADMLQAIGDVQQAVDIYTDYLLENPDDLNSVMKLGKIYQQHDVHDGMEWAMNYILAKDPGNHAAKAMLNSLDQSQASGK